MGVRCSQSKGRQVADLHFPLPELQRLHKAAGEDRAGHPERSYLLDRRQPQHPQERSGQGVAHRASPDRARLHPQGGGMAEYDRGMVAAIPAAGASRDRFRRQLRDRLCEEGRYSPVESQSEAVGVGTTSKAAEASEAHFCVPSLRNGALRSRGALCFTLRLQRGAPGPPPLRLWPTSLWSKGEHHGRSQCE